MGRKLTLTHRDDNLEHGICSICGGEYHNYGNNASPINEGRCCDECNGRVVAARVRDILRRTQ
jgi:hypothetical protein